MKKLIGTYKIYLLGTLFLLVLVVLLPLLVEKIFWSWHESFSINTTKYIFFSYLAFFVIIAGSLIPITRKISRFMKFKKRNFLDGIATVIILIISTIPLAILITITVFLLKQKILFKYRYIIFHYAISTAFFLLGVKIRFNGKRNKFAKIFPINHTSPLDYPLMCLSMGIDPYNVVAGINLKYNRKTLEDKIISFTLGNIIKNYSISVDRSDSKSKVNVLVRMRDELEDGKNISISASDGRLLKKKIKDGVILKEFQDGAFWFSWKYKQLIQPIVFDWPVIYRGKGEDWWGVHPCVIDIFYLNVINPSDYNSVEDLKNACFKVMYDKLKSSKRVMNFQKELSEK
ncbi:MAG: hypothetical protein WA101_03110 [Minisyncoccia bacterium]